ncbi:Uncharacterised protein [Actinobaculum suis]|uniref:Uncharacterized protein n=1 Tax=Actinobaculum suis TaxID=1657 RepID=A0A7Z8Y756_9ACTO|nr:Uncharacterised protein [Actinobaculum suis]
MPVNDAARLLIPQAVPTPTAGGAYAYRRRCLRLPQAVPTPTARGAYALPFCDAV